MPAGSLERVLNVQREGSDAAKVGFAGRLRAEVPQEKPAGDDRIAAKEVTMSCFERLSHLVGEAFLQPWEGALQELDPTHLIIVPHGELHLLPLHAASLLDGSCLIERFPIVYLPNTAVARSLARRQETPRPNGRLVMGPAGFDLEYAALETDMLAKKWKLEAEERPYVLGRMRADVLKEHARMVERAHLATHSAFDPENYLCSSILFYDRRLTILEIFSDPGYDFHGMALFYLSSCESGMIRPDAGDELPGLVWTLLYKGADSVMASLWPVEDHAAYEMSEVFYSEWDGGLTSMEAHREAVLKLRATPDRSNPYFWAPFILSGQGFLQGKNTEPTDA